MHFGHDDTTLEFIERLNGFMAEHVYPAEATARELVNAIAMVQAGQARLESAARELEEGKKAVATANATAQESGVEAVPLRDQIETAKPVKLPKKPA